MSKGSTRRPEDSKAFSDGYDLAFGTKPQIVPKTPKPPEDNPDFRMSPDICSVCGETLVDWICPKMLEQQKERT